jgi:hypothetical protein
MGLIILRGQVRLDYKHWDDWDSIDCSLTFEDDLFNAVNSVFQNAHCNKDNVLEGLQFMNVFVRVCARSQMTLGREAMKSFFISE